MERHSSWSSNIIFLKCWASSYEYVYPYHLTARSGSGPSHFFAVLSRSASDTSKVPIACQCRGSVERYLTFQKHWLLQFSAAQITDEWMITVPVKSLTWITALFQTFAFAKNKKAGQLFKFSPRLIEKESLTNSIPLWQGEAKRPGKIIKHNKAIEQFWSLIKKKKKEEDKSITVQRVTQVSRNQLDATMLLKNNESMKAGVDKNNKTVEWESFQQQF